MDIENKKVTNKYPRGLWLFVFAEFWDRFSFCGTLTVLMLYLTKVFAFTDAQAYGAWGAYNALGYITPVLGGIIADRVLGFERPIIFGLLLIMLGNLLLTLSSLIALNIGIALTLCGIGFFKGNISILVGTLYQSDDRTKENAYSLFFMGIVLGATLGPTVYGLLALYIGWSAGFMISACGTGLTLILFLIRRKHFRYLTLPARPSPTLWVKRISYGSVLIVMFLSSLLFLYPVISNNMLGIVCILSILGLMLYAMTCSKSDAKKIFGMTLLDLLLVYYYGASMQVNGSLVMGVDRDFHLTLLGWTIPATLFASLEAMFAFILLPIFAKFWIFLARNYFQPSFFFKLIMGHGFAALSFAIFALSFGKMLNPYVGLIVANLFLGMSVVCIYPTHLTAISEYAPVSVKGTMMGMSLLSSAFSGYIGAIVINIFQGNAKVINYAYLYQHMAIQLCTFGMLILLAAWTLRWLWQNETNALAASSS